MLVAFDFDGTLSDTEMIDLLGEQAGVAAEIEDMTERAMNDELDYATSLRRRVALLDGLSTRRVEATFDDLRLRPGADEVLEALSDASVTTAILTGGFEDGVRRALAHADVEVDHIVANRLLAENDRLTGEVEGPLIDGTKDDSLIALVEDLGITLDETVAVGDGTNDLPMLKVAGRAIGFRPKGAVEAHCDAIVHEMDDLATELLAYDVL